MEYRPSDVDWSDKDIFECKEHKHYSSVARDICRGATAKVTEKKEAKT